MAQPYLVLRVSEHFPDRFKENDRQNPEGNREEAVERTLFVANGRVRKFLCHFCFPVLTVSVHLLMFPDLSFSL